MTIESYDIPQHPSHSWKVSFRLTDIDDRLRVEAILAPSEDSARAAIEAMENAHTVEFVDVYKVDSKTGLRLK